MSLSGDDLQSIRSIIREEVAPVSGELEALRNDIKEIYDMISALEKRTNPTRDFNKLTIEQKLLKLNSELLMAAKQAGVNLPR